jgi:hypothetical protein
MTIRPGDFWLASVPYTDGSGAKIRPVLYTQKGHISNTDARRIKDIWAKHIKLQF